MKQLYSTDDIKKALQNMDKYFGTYPEHRYEGIKAFEWITEQVIEEKDWMKELNEKG